MQKENEAHVMLCEVAAGAWKSNYRASADREKVRERQRDTVKDERSSCYVSGNQEGISLASALGDAPRGKLSLRRQPQTLH